MKAAIVNPYWDTLGGGERYTASVVQILLKQGYRVDIQWGAKDVKKTIKNRFNLEIEKANIVKDVNRGDGYDLCFWVSDGSIPTLKSRNNILHFQFPFKGVGGNSLMNKMKLFRIKSIVCNSELTKSFIDREFNVKSIVLYPPVDTKKIKSKRKEDIILYVGRFSTLMQSKNQDVLIKVFRKLYDNGAKNWKLILAGGTEVGVGKYMDELKELSKGYPIRFIESPSYKNLVDLYGRSKIFWSASGYRVDENVNPTRVEHFGMTVVESMAAGCVPVVVRAGGHREIIKNGTTGYLWSTKVGLINKTRRLIADPKQWRSMSKNAKERSKDFSLENFEKELLALL